ncbi:unnamed protein product [Coccothraustes coccothraustes]
MIPKKWEQTFPYDEYQHQSPLCKLVLTLPKHEKLIHCPQSKREFFLIDQIYELLCCWKKTLPKSADKQQLLSRYLQKSGRSDLSEELRFKWQNKVFT